MAHISLTDSQRQELQHLARRGRDARVVRRAQGLLWLDQGEHPIAVAQRLGVTRESVYAWVRRLQHQGARSLVEKLMEQPRSGRPREKRHAGQELVQQVMDIHPSQYGYPAEGWTAALLRHHLKTTEDIEVSDATGAGV
jgi:transposase